MSLNAVLEKDEYLSPMAKDKPKMNSHELVEKMESKGIDFKDLSSDEVEKYLLNSNNFLRICSYRKNYNKYQRGENVGKYEHLDFNQLKALAILDLKLRKAMLGMCLDVEHSLKLYILRDFENSDNDGYSIVQNFFKTTRGEEVANKIAIKQNNEYVKGLTDKYIYIKQTDKIYSVSINDYKTKEIIDYNLDIPIWIMLEMMTFGDLLYFYDFYYPKSKQKNSPCPPINYRILKSIKNLRNACAHNNCLLNNFRDESVKINAKISNFIKNLEISEFYPRLKCRPLYEMICVLYALETLASSGVKNYDFNNMQEIFNNFDCKYSRLFYENSSNDLNIKSINFLKNTIDKLIAVC